MIFVFCYAVHFVHLLRLTAQCPHLPHTFRVVGSGISYRRICPLGPGLAAPLFSLYDSSRVKINGFAALDESCSLRKRSLIMNKWFWAWRRLKYGESKDSADLSKDEALLSTLIDTILYEKIPAGDGKFSRLSNFISQIKEEATWIKGNLSTTDETFIAFILGIEVAFESMQLIAEKIKKGR